ncbi:hypothetical protein QQG74_09840 [Micromonospora sp. FIMYZ51]|uniref:hypothetical protein n=1 Tax=Micromonospora sp. FIMYZ51 TaxID=3051832 RepID=UPI00311F31E7
MAATATLPHRPDIDTGAGDVDHHYIHCDPDTALCGVDLTGVPEGPERGRVCPLCVLVVDGFAPCPGCGL